MENKNRLESQYIHIKAGEESMVKKQENVFNKYKYKIIEKLNKNLKQKIDILQLPKHNKRRKKNTSQRKKKKESIKSMKRLAINLMMMKYMNSCKNIKIMMKLSLMS